MPRGRSPARAAAAADAAATPSAEVASPTFSPPAFPSSRDPLVAVAQAGAQLAVANANVVAARPVVPIEISLAGDAPGAPLVVVDVRAGMARDELEQCIAFAFKRRHKVGAVEQRLEHMESKFDTISKKIEQLITAQTGNRGLASTAHIHEMRGGEGGYSSD